MSYNYSSQLFESSSTSNIPFSSSNTPFSSSNTLSEDIDFNYISTRQNIYNYYDYTKILIVLFIVMFFIYLMVVINKFN